MGEREREREGEERRGEGDTSVTVGMGMWPVSSVQGEDSSTAPSAVEDSSSETEEGGHTYPVALTVTYGAMGAYFNLSFLPCEALSLSSQHTNTRTHLPSFATNSNSNSNSSSATYHTSAMFSPTCSPAHIVDPFSVPSAGYSRVVI